MCDWSSLLAHAFADEGPESDSFAPEWIAAPALAALGFGLRADLIGAWIDDRRWSKRRPDRQRLDSWIARLTRPEPRPGAFVLRRDTTSLLGAWPVSNAAPVLALTHRDAIRLAGFRDPNRSRSFSSISTSASSPSRCRSTSRPKLWSAPWPIGGRAP